MQAGQLTERISVEQLIQGIDEVGQPIDDWRHVFDAWADIRHMGGLESIKAGAETSITKASIRIRRRPTQRVSAAMRVIHDGTVYGVEAVLPNRRSAYIDLVCNTTGEPQ